MEQINSIDLLANAIQQTNRFFLAQTQQQVNVALTIRNLMIGYYIIEYEQLGEDRAAYGHKVYSEITERLRKKRCYIFERKAFISLQGLLQHISGDFADTVRKIVFG